MRGYLRGFFCLNLGDDLFIHILAQRYPDINFCLISNSEYASAYLCEKNISVIKLNKLDRVIQKFKSSFLKIEDVYEKTEKLSDVSILIGGSMFQEFPGDIGALERLKSFPGKYNDTYILGVNFGPFQTQEYLKASFEYFKMAKDICFRDLNSYLLFKEMNNVRWARDIVFSIKSIIPQVNEKKKICAISVINFNSRKYLADYKEDYIDFMLKIVKHYCAMRFSIHLISFCKMEGDEEAITEILEKCDDELKEFIKEVKYDGKNWRKIVEDISSAECVIATRFHSMILGIVYQVPTLPIVYNEKCYNVLKDIGYDNAGVKVEELRKMKIEDLEFIQIENIDAIEKDASKQFWALDKLFGRELHAE